MPYIAPMPVTLELPPEVVAAFGDNLEKTTLELLLLQLIQAEKMSVAKAGSLLGLNRLDAIRWYTSHGHAFPNWDEEEWQRELEAAKHLGRQGDVPTQPLTKPTRSLIPARSFLRRSASS